MKTQPVASLTKVPYRMVFLDRKYRAMVSRMVCKYMSSCMVLLHSGFFALVCPRVSCCCIYYAPHCTALFVLLSSMIM